MQYPIEALEGPVLHGRVDVGCRIVESAISAARHLQTAADFETIRTDNLTVLRPTQRLARLKPGKFTREPRGARDASVHGRVPPFVNLSGLFQGLNR